MTFYENKVFCDDSPYRRWARIVQSYSLYGASVPPAHSNTWFHGDGPREFATQTRYLDRRLGRICTRLTSATKTDTDHTTSGHAKEWSASSTSAGDAD